jgi:hypothetical protein
MLNYRFLPHAAFVNTAAGTSLIINQIESEGPDSGIKLFEEASGSEYDRMFVADKSIEPVVKFDTSDLTVLTTVGLAGVLINPGMGTPGMTFFGRYFPTGGLPAATSASSHLSLLISDGLLVPISVRASHNSVAKVSLQAHAVLGSTATYSSATPFVWTPNQAITSGATATANIYTTGPLKIDGTLYQGIEDINVNFGIEVVKEGSDGDVYPSFIGIIMRMTSIEFTTANPQLMATFGDAYALSSSFAAYFRQVLADGTRVPIATTTHIKVSGTTGMITPNNANLAFKRPGTASFTYRPVGTTQLAIAAAAIPAS